MIQEERKTTFKDNLCTVQNLVVENESLNQASNKASTKTSKTRKKADNSEKNSSKVSKKAEKALKEDTEKAKKTTRRARKKLDNEITLDTTNSAPNLILEDSKRTTLSKTKISNGIEIEVIGISKKDSKTSSKKSSKKKARTKTSSNKVAVKSTTKSKDTELETSDEKHLLATPEYYDLPYRYNQTTVKILAQTPTMLFIYWDISDDDRKAYINKYGESFFNDTKPVLIITNKTMNYTFEVEINDFANSWYLHLNDPDCDYSVELGRRPKYSNNSYVNTYNNSNSQISEEKIYKPLDSYIYICTSNDMEMPNNRILFDKLGKSVFFKNVKTNFVEEKFIASLSFITNMGKVYNIYDLYKEIYKDEINLEDLASDNIKLNLSSSNSSTFK